MECAESFAGESDLTVELECLSVHAVAPFSGVWADVVRAYKQDPAPGVADLVEPLFARLLRERVDEVAPGSSVVFDPAPTLVPVPMAPVRRRERGFSPAERLVTSMARELGWPSSPHLLRRVRYRRTLRGLSAAERRKEIQGAIVVGPGAATWMAAERRTEVHGAIVVGPGAATWMSAERRTEIEGALVVGPGAAASMSAERRAEIEGAIAVGQGATIRMAAERPRRIVLIDDVLTTGSTLEACAAAVRSLPMPSIELVAAVLGATPEGEA